MSSYSCVSSTPYETCCFLYATMHDLCRLLFLPPSVSCSFPFWFVCCLVQWSGRNGVRRIGCRTRRIGCSNALLGSSTSLFCVRLCKRPLKNAVKLSLITLFRLLNPKMLRLHCCCLCNFFHANACYQVVRFRTYVARSLIYIFPIMYNKRATHWWKENIHMYFSCN